MSVERELFEVEPSKSPRLRWRERHRVVTQEFPDRAPGDEDDFGNELHRWEAWRAGTKFTAGGATEDEAMLALARARGWRSWTEEAAGL